MSFLWSAAGVKIITMIKLDQTTFLNSFFQKLNEVGIDISQYEMDHLGYQASSNEDYDQLKQELQKEGDFSDSNNPCFIKTTLLLPWN